MLAGREVQPTTPEPVVQSTTPESEARQQRAENATPSALTGDVAAPAPPVQSGIVGPAVGAGGIEARPAVNQPARATSTSPAQLAGDLLRDPETTLGDSDDTPAPYRDDALESDDDGSVLDVDEFIATRRKESCRAREGQPAIPADVRRRSERMAESSRGNSAEGGGRSSGGRRNTPEPNRRKEGTQVSGRGVQSSPGRRGYVSAWEHRSARNNLVRMTTTGTVVKERKRRVGIADDVIRATVQYILQSNNVQYMAWGTRRILADGRKLRFPVLIRKTGAETMWRNYAKDGTVLPMGKAKVKRTTFMEIVSKLTTADVKQRACIDYKLHALVYENCTTLERIVDDKVVEAKVRKELKKSVVCLNF